MIDKLMGKKKKDGDTFIIPQKKYTTDSKLISKMSTGNLKDLFYDQQKYISILVQKLQGGKQQYDKLQQKIDELQEKNEIVNSQISKMTNQHQQLTIKFDNLQSNLLIISGQSDQQYKKQMQFLNQNQVSCEKIKSLNAVLGYYRQRVQLCKKIQMQNKNLKNKYTDLQEQNEELRNKIKSLQQDKTFNNLIPTLMQQIKELKQKNKQSQNSNDLRAEFQKFQKNVLEKVKTQIQTVSTIKSSEEEELEDKLLHKKSQTQKLSFQLRLSKEKLWEAEQKIEDFTRKIQKLQQQLKKVKSNFQASQNVNEILKSKISSKQSQLKQLNSKYQAQLSNIQKNKLQIIELGKINEQKIKIGQKLIILEQKQQQKSKNLNLLNQKNKQMQQLIKMKENQLQQKQMQIKKQKQKGKQYENMFSNNNKNNTEIQNLLKIKNKLESQLEQYKKNNENLKRNINQLNNKIKQNSQQLQNFKKINQRLAEEKTIFQENSNNVIKINQEQNQRYKNSQKQLKKNIQQLKKQVQTNNGKMKQISDQNRNYTSQIQKLVKTLQNKEVELKKSYATVNQLQKQKNGINSIIGQKQQDNKIRIRKFQSQLNQQRIKIENQNRKITNLQTKLQQNKASMDHMYEQSINKDKKISHMEIKLKQYKYLIQVLRKQKIQIEKNYQNKLTNMKPSFQQSEEIQVKAKVVPHVISDEKNVDIEKQNMKNQILSIKQQNLVILAENEHLRNTIQQLEEVIETRNQSIKILKQKRDQIMKEIDKMNRNHKGSENQGKNNFMSPKTFTSIEVQSAETRVKRIATKAHKGFDILIKIQHQIYKNFMSVFTSDLSRAEVKKIQGQINILIKKSNDMKDIFEDYL